MCFCDAVDVFLSYLKKLNVDLNGIRYCDKKKCFTIMGDYLTTALKSFDEKKS